MQILSWSFPNLFHYVGINVDHHHQNVKSETEVSQSVVWCMVLCSSDTQNLAKMSYS